MSIGFFFPEAILCATYSDMDGRGFIFVSASGLVIFPPYTGIRPLLQCQVFFDRWTKTKRISHLVGRDVMMAAGNWWMQEKKPGERSSAFHGSLPSPPKQDNSKVFILLSCKETRFLPWEWLLRAGSFFSCTLTALTFVKQGKITHPVLQRFGGFQLKMRRNRSPPSSAAATP